MAKTGTRDVRAIAAALSLALLALAVHLVTSGRYGFFRDELYFIACGRRLAWGYVDQPPLVPALTRLSGILFGNSLPGLRLWAALAHAGCVALTFALARRLGGGLFACALAAICVLLSPQQLSFGYLLSTNTFEPLLWTGCAFLAATAIVHYDPKSLAPIGLLVGIGLMDKHSMAFYACALVAGLLCTPQRKLLFSKWFVLAVALALLIVAPQVEWQRAHGWPMLELLENGRLHKNAEVTWGAFLKEQVLAENPGALLVWLAGLLWLLLSPRFKSLGIAFALVCAFLLFAHGKPYYLGPAFPVLFAAGGVAVEQWLSRFWLRAVIAAPALATGLLIAPIVLPVFPIAEQARVLQRLGVVPERLEKMEYNDLPSDLADQFGWESLAASVAAAWAQVPQAERAHTLVYARNYGDAGAVEFFTSDRPAVISAHNNYYYWSLPLVAQAEALLVIARADDNWCGRHDFAQARLLGHHREPLAMPYESDLNLWLCSAPARPVAEQFTTWKTFQ